jgi:hypothetical protein
MFATGHKRTAGCGHHYTASRVHPWRRDVVCDTRWALLAGTARDDRIHLKNDSVAVGIHQLVHDVVQLLGS